MEAVPGSIARCFVFAGASPAGLEVLHGAWVECAKHVAAACGQALEYQMQQGVAEGVRSTLYLMPLAAQHDYGPELKADVCMLKLLQPP